MATLDIKHAPHVSEKDLNANVLHKEYTLDEEGKTPSLKIDYSGAHEKTDPAEIKLVRKLDLWIMVSTTPCSSSSPCEHAVEAMYKSHLLLTPGVAYSLVNVLAQLS